MTHSKVDERNLKACERMSIDALCKRHTGALPFCAPCDPGPVSVPIRIGTRTIMSDVCFCQSVLLMRPERESIF